MYDIIRTIEFFTQHRSKSETVSKKMLSFYNIMSKKKMILITGVTDRKRSQSEHFFKYAKFDKIMYDIIRTIKFLTQHR